ncbi:hypothetical protein SOM61_01915 [Massilia sp. CFBP9012]|uniref:hypothetical protein n=1 Tax=Massilia sp. CFBP9012 TaxID=3096531 RepID=UPI002A6B8630|nr:hypothetical protein [Massilia sp. CFBP9012]MDY0973703.1 hypothetical protein [Massilia sp. CFBP9012]
MRLAASLLLLCLGSVGAPAAQAFARTPLDGEQIASATVVLYPSGIYPRAPLTESGLARQGCTFTTTGDSARHVALAGILNRRLADGPEGDGFPNHLRNLVYLQLRDGSRLRYTFTDEYDAQGRVYGWVDSYAGDGRPLVAGRELLFDLRDWAAGVPDRKNFRTECLDKTVWPPGSQVTPPQ